MSKSYLYSNKLIKTQKYLFSKMDAIIGRMIDSYIIKGCSEEGAKKLTYNKFIEITNRVYNK